MISQCHPSTIVDRGVDLERHRWFERAGNQAREAKVESIVTGKRTMLQWLLDLFKVAGAGLTTGLITPLLQLAIDRVTGLVGAVAVNVHHHRAALEAHLRDRPPIAVSVEEPEALAEVLDRLHELVVKPVDGSGGKGLVVGPDASPAELEKLLSAERPSVGLRLMDETGLLRVVLPELAVQRGIPQDKVPGEDLLDHSLRSVDAAPAERSPSVSSSST